ncbi:pyridoxamine 5'-phosphate oxidase [Egibacter rhizosphaerae]|uniref:pyridoxamine 5'-phosphate oxidase n=1 Tax=Egibacter rhizosphaerae TaxID=1670831 RepID=UPI00197AE5D1|nr:pyridoxamine 5'-phosphate oxidase [Egibacter rhizosphaerae]
MDDTSFDPAAVRREYARAILRSGDLDPDPIAQLGAWLEAATAAGNLEPNAMVLATASAEGLPSARTVLLKELDARGLGFHTNLRSRKARELAVNPRASAVFWWPEIERQVIVEGVATRLGDAEADELFMARPRGARLAAHASVQSRPVEGRQELEDRVAEVARRFEDAEPTRPPWFGGFRLGPTVVEVWQGGQDRVHDRFRYQRDADGWRVERLGP